MEESADRGEAIPEDYDIQQYAGYALYTVRDLGTQFWEWCGHTKEKLNEFLLFRQTDEIHENWVDVNSDLDMVVTETPEQHVYEFMDRHSNSYGTALSAEEKDADLRRIQVEKSSLMRKYRELESKLQEYEAGSVAHDELSVQMSSLREERDALLDARDDRLDKLQAEKDDLQAELERTRREKEELMAAQLAVAQQIALKESEEKMEQEEPPLGEEVEELRQQLYESRDETKQLLTQLNAYNGVGLCSKFKTAREVHDLMIDIIPNEYTSAIELLENDFGLDPDEDTLPYEICLKLFWNVFAHTKYRQKRFFDIIRDNSVFKIDMSVAQKVFWGLIQDNFELLGVTPIEQVVEGILAVTEDAPDDEMGKFEHFVSIDLEDVEDVLRHKLMRQYMTKCAQISFFVLWSKEQQLALAGWEQRPGEDDVFDDQIHQRIWDNGQEDTQIQAIVFPALYRVEEHDGEQAKSLLTKRYVFCSGYPE